MLDFLDTAHPFFTLTLAVVVLVTLWALALLNQRVRVLQDRLDSMERSQRLFEEGIESLSRRPAATSPAPQTRPAEPIRPDA
jgi:hypothetical protein